MVLPEVSTVTEVGWFGRNATSIPLAVALVLSVALSAIGIGLWSQYILGFFLWSVAIGVSAMFCFVRFWRKRLRPGPWSGQIALGLMAIGLSVPFLNWPLHLTFLASRPALERIAADVQAHGAVAHPQRAGVFIVERADIRRGGRLWPPTRDVVCLWTDCDPAGGTGFMQCTPDEGAFNIQSSTTLSDRWQYITED